MITQLKIVFGVGNMRKFDIKKLPKDILAKIDIIEFVDSQFFDNETLGELWLKDEFEFDFDNSSYTTFNSRKELIEVVRYCAKKRG